jgi:hypothetical protein
MFVMLIVVAALVAVAASVIGIRTIPLTRVGIPTVAFPDERVTSGTEENVTPLAVDVAVEAMRNQRS